MQKITYKSFGYILAALVLPCSVSAQVLITEIMYDLAGVDGGGEWVEIYNAGTSNVSILTGGASNSWRFSDGSQHSLNLIKGDTILAPGEYAVIVDSSLRFFNSYPRFSGNILDSSLSLNNAVGEVALLQSKDGIVLNNVAYSSSQGGAGDGASLQLQSDGNWIAALPTPGAKNAAVASVQNNTFSGSTNQTLSAHYGSVPTSKNTPRQTLDVGAGRQRIGAVGSPMEFKVDTSIDHTKYNNFIWNFGDGTEAGGSILSHVYKYPGEYVVVLNASFHGKGEAVSRINVTIIDPELAVTAAGTERIEIANNSSYEVNLFGRALVAGEKFFVFPKDTIIGAGQSLSFASNVTGLQPSSQYEAYIAVLGDAEHPQFRAKIEEEKTKQITFIKNQLSNLQKKLEEMFSRER